MTKNESNVCKACGQKFEVSTTTCTKKMEGGKETIYETCSWSINYICPHCGHDNNPLK